MSKGSSKARAQPAQFMGAELWRWGAVLRCAPHASSSVEVPGSGIRGGDRGAATRAHAATVIVSYVPIGYCPVGLSVYLRHCAAPLGRAEQKCRIVTDLGVDLRVAF